MFVCLLVCLFVCGSALLQPARRVCVASERFSWSLLSSISFKIWGFLSTPNRLCLFQLLPLPMSVCFSRPLPLCLSVNRITTVFGEFSWIFRGAVCDVQELVRFWWWSGSRWIKVRVGVAAALAKVCALHGCSCFLPMCWRGFVLISRWNNPKNVRCSVGFSLRTLEID